MTPLVAALVAVLAIWMFCCAYAGYHVKPLLFLAVLLSGIGLNTIWMILRLEAHPLEYHALVAQGALTLYGFGALGAGWLLGRLVRQFRASRVDDTVG